MAISISPESMEPHVPVLNLVAGNLVKNPEWSIRLLESLARQLVVPLLRQERDGATELGEAIEAGLQLAHHEPEGVEDWVTLAHLFARAGRLKESLGWVDRALVVKPERADYHRLRASMLERLGRVEEALEVAAQALALKPDDPELAADLERTKAAYMNSLRQQRDRSPDLTSAIEAGLKLAHRETDGVEDWVALAHLLAKAKRLNESLGWVDRALEKKLDVADYHRLRASVLERLGRFDEALPAAKRALELSPDHNELAADLKRIEAAYSNRLRQQRDGSQDLALRIEAGLKLAHSKPEGVEDWLRLAHLLAKAERLPEALKCVDQIISCESRVAEYHRFRSSVLERLGRFKNAYYAARKARFLDPGNPALVEDVRRTLTKMILHYVGLSVLLRNGLFGNRS